MQKFFQDPNTGALYKKILNNEYAIPEFISEDASDILRRILTTDPVHRMKISEIKNHPWITQYNDVKINEGIIVGYNRIPVNFNNSETKLFLFRLITIF